MKKKGLGILLVVLGGLSLLLLLAQIVDFYPIQNRYLYGAVVFMAVAFPSFGFRLIRK
jgi:hypothetical protein